MTRKKTFLAGFAIGAPYAFLGQVMSRKAKILIVTISIACVLLAVALPNFIRARNTSSRDACLMNLRQIDKAEKRREMESSTTNFQSGGFLHMESYIDRLLRSQKESATVIVATADGPHALLVKRQADRTVLSISPDRLLNNVEGSRIKEFFSRRGMIPSRVVRSANPVYDNAIQGFEFQLPSDPKAIARLCLSVFTELYGVTDQYGLSFTTEGL